MQMLTIAESAKITGKHPDTIRRLIKRLLKEDGKDKNNITQELLNGGFSYRISKDYLLSHIQVPSATVEMPMQEPMHANMHTKFANGHADAQSKINQQKQPHLGMHTDTQAHSMQAGSADTQVLRETIEILKGQLREKDKQIEQLLERARETNFLLKGYQDRYLLEAPMQTTNNTPAGSQPTKSEQRKPHKSTKQLTKPNQQQKKKGFLSWFR